MKQDIDPPPHEEAENTKGAEPPGPDAVLDAAEPHTDPNISFRELVVRETLTDLENAMTADHHLDKSGLPTPPDPDSP
jgi:hypothetical protein